MLHVVVMIVVVPTVTMLTYVRLVNIAITVDDVHQLHAVVILMLLLWLLSVRSGCPLNVMIVSRQLIDVPFHIIISIILVIVQCLTVRIVRPSAATLQINYQKIFITFILMLKKYTDTTSLLSAAVTSLSFPSTCSAAAAATASIATTSWCCTVSCQTCSQKSQ